MGKYQKIIIHRKLKVLVSVIFSHPKIQYIPTKASKLCQKSYQINDLGTVHEPPNPSRAGAWDRSRLRSYFLVGAWIARSVPCEPRRLTVSHACDPRMHREPGILNRAYENKRSRAVHPPRARRFTPILGRQQVSI